MTKNFKQEEYQCRCCDEMNISPTIVLLNQLVRDRFNVPVTITSGCRCKKHNKNVGGAEHSQHTPQDDGFCHASDIQVLGVEPIIVYNFLHKLFPNSLGLGIYDNWLHIDDRMSMAYRWDSRSK